MTHWLYVALFVGTFLPAAAFFVAIFMLAPGVGRDAKTTRTETLTRR